MERIRKAMELARRDRELGAGPVVGCGHARGAVPGAATALIASAAAVARASDIAPAAVPLDAATLERNRILDGSSPQTVREAYKMLRTQVLQRMREHDFRTLAVVSAASGEGKSLTAINLAISIAQDANSKVLLVDLDLRRPSIHALFGLIPPVGLGDYLADRCSLQQAMYRPEPYERLVLLPVREPVVNGSELLSPTRMRELVAQIRTCLPDSVVLIDLPPVLLSDDALAFSPWVDAGLLVACEGRTRREDLVRTLELLRATKIVGTVLNRSSEPGSGVY
jgi:capsular exopolysaccharide synthesis family protein